MLSLFEGSEIGSYLLNRNFQLLLILIGLFANRPDNTEQENSNIVAKFVRKEADQGRGDEDTEGKDCVPVVGAMSKICIANNYLTRKKCK